MFHFVPNLKPYTFFRGRGNRRFDAYLLSVDYMRQHKALAKRVVGEERLLAADNGNVDLIRELLARYAGPARALDELRKKEEKKRGGYLQPGELSASLSEAYRALAEDIRAASKEATHESRTTETTQLQSAMDASYLVGMEDLTVATMTGLSMEPEYTMLPQSFYQALSERAVRFALDQQQCRYGICSGTVFAGLHAIDYDTAQLAGRLAGEAGVKGIASGLVGALRDKNYVDYRIADGALVPLPRPVPRPYLRVMEIVAGYYVGYGRATGKRLRFHGLGVGTPILLPLLSVFGDADTLLATDSTAPIVDGWTSPTISLYVDRPAPLKYKAHRIAEYWLRDGYGWDCPCPYCQDFMERHPHDVDGARRWWKSRGSPRLTRADMHRSSELSHLLPILGAPADPNLRRDAAMTRVAHNHWVLKRLESASRRAAREGRLREWVAETVDRYDRAPISASWRAAVQESWKLAQQALLSMGNVEPQPWNG